MFIPVSLNAILIILFLSLVLELPRYLCYNISIGKIIRIIVLVFLFAVAAFVIYQYGFP